MNDIETYVAIKEAVANSIRAAVSKQRSIYGNFTVNQVEDLVEIATQGIAAPFYQFVYNRTGQIDNDAITNTNWADGAIVAYDKAKE